MMLRFLKRFQKNIPTNATYNSDWYRRKLAQLPAPSPMQWPKLAQAHCDSFNDLTAVLAQPTLSTMQQALSVARVQKSTQLYYNYVNVVLDTAVTYQTTLPIIRQIQALLTKASFNGDVSVAIQQLYEHDLKHQLPTLIELLPDPIKEAVSKNYRALMAHYDNAAWTRRYFASNYADRQHQFRKIYADYQRYETGNSIDQHFLNANSFKKTVQLANPLVQWINDQLFDQVFSADFSHDINDDLLVSHHPQTIAEWTLLWLYLTQYHLNHFQVSFKQMVELDMNLSLNHTQCRWQNFDMIGSLTIAPAIGSFNWSEWTHCYLSGGGTKVDTGVRTYSGDPKSLQIHEVLQTSFQRLRTLLDNENPWLNLTRLVSKPVVINWLKTGDNQQLRFMKKNVGLDSYVNNHTNDMQKPAGANYTMVSPTQLSNDYYVQFANEKALTQTVIPTMQNTKQIKQLEHVCGLRNHEAKG